MALYKIYCPESELENLPQEVEVKESYPAFSIVSAPAEVVDSLRRYYPAEELRTEERRPTRDAARGAILRDAGMVREAGVAAVDGEKVVRFTAPVKERWKSEIESRGAVVIRPLGDSSMAVSIPTAAIEAAVRQMPQVASVEPFVPTFRISQEFLRGLQGGEVSQEALADASMSAAAGEVVAPPGRNVPVPGMLIASFFSEEDRERAAAVLDERGVRIANRVGTSRLILDLTSVADPRKALEDIAEQPGLRILEEKTIKSLFNDVAREVIGKGVVSSGSGTGGVLLTGRGEIVAIADSGLDTGAQATLHADFRGRVSDLTSFPIAASFSSSVTNPGGDDGAGDNYSGHGTHVAGSAVGDGSQAANLGLPPIRGMAPEATLIFQAIEQTPKWNLQARLSFLRNGRQPPVSGLFGIPDDLRDLLQHAYDRGARIHSNSWGGGEPGAYDYQCEQLDRFVWENRDFLVLVAAGNSGRNASAATHSIDQPSVDSPGTAKNCLTVGACENDRPGQFSDTYGAWWPNDFPHPPFHADGMVDSIDDIVAFSSRGPCNTGRNKPDVVAPGTFILSARSSQIAANNFAWGAFSSAKRHYMYMGGTSMATPLVAGSAAVVRQHLRQRLGVINPSAALLKACLIHSADYLNYRFRHASSEEFLDNEQGWGRVNLSRIVSPSLPTRIVFIDEARALATGREHRYRFLVQDGAVPFKVTLAYTDFPGEDLVNNLNLLVSGPGGQFFLGNDSSGSRRTDSVNNIEAVVVRTPAAGEWTVRVVASEVLENPQDFSLVISGGGLSGPLP